MQLFKKLFCHWDLVRFIPEECIVERGFTISLTDGHNLEFMIFLGRADNNSEYEVKIYKNRPDDKYVPSKLDNNIKRYEENDKYTIFFFDDYAFANQFVSLVGYAHPEYQVRPVREIEKDKKAKKLKKLIIS